MTDAAQVACVDPSRSESGSTDPEVRQSADRNLVTVPRAGGGIVSGPPCGWRCPGDCGWDPDDPDDPCAISVPSTSEGEGA